MPGTSHTQRKDITVNNQGPADEEIITRRVSILVAGVPGEQVMYAGAINVSDIHIYNAGGVQCVVTFSDAGIVIDIVVGATSDKTVSFNGRLRFQNQVRARSDLVGPVNVTITGE